MSMKKSTYKQKLCFRKSSSLHKTIAKLKKQGKRLRVRGRLTKTQREQLFAIPREIRLEFRYFCYNDFKMEDEKILNNVGISIHHWDLYVY